MMNLPKRYFWIAAGAAAGFGLMMVRKKLRGEDGSEGGQNKDSGTASKNGSRSSKSSGSSSGAEADNSDQEQTDQEDGAKEAKLPGAVADLTEFLAGESWFDEMGWQGVWEREGIESPENWLRSDGLAALGKERKKLVDHPALLAGCRRRWIVVCRYAGIDVSDAAGLWNQTD